MNTLRRTTALAVLALALITLSATPSVASGGGADVSRLVTGLGQSYGSTIGPDGALYVTDPVAGAVSRIDRRTGQVTSFVDGLPPQIPGTGGGAIDVIFRHHTAYVLVIGVAEDLGGDDVVGIYRVDGPHAVSVFADLGAFNIANPPDTDFFVPTGVPYALENYRGGFLVSDGHHNRVLKVTASGAISELVAFGNVVPTGLEVRGNRVWLAQAGPIPHLPKDGKVVTFGVKHPKPRTVATGGRLLVDVEFGRHGALYALAQGVWPAGGQEGSPASPNTGQLLRVNHGRFSVVARGLDRPTSLEIVGSTAYIVTLTGEVWTVDLGKRHRRS